MCARNLKSKIQNIFMSPEKAFTQQQKDAMVTAIKLAEKDTSGEIRVHIENHSKIDVLDRAADVFAH